MLTSISQTIDKGFGVTFQEMLKSKHFQEGKKMFQECKFKIKGVEPKWVKKTLTESRLEGDSSYCILNKEGNGYTVGFCIGKEPMFPDYEKCSEEDLYKIAEQRKYQNIYPSPLKATEAKSQGGPISSTQEKIEDKEDFEFVFGENG